MGDGVVGVHKSSPVNVVLTPGPLFSRSKDLRHKVKLGPIGRSSDIVKISEDRRERTGVSKRKSLDLTLVSQSEKLKD